jgi:predicted Zn-dependent protease
MLQAALGQALAATGETDRALQTFEQGLAIAPRNVPLTVRYAELLMQLERPKEAHAVLLDLFNNVAPTPEQIRQTAMAASAAGDTGDAYYYMSEYHIASGDLILAVKQLELALAVPNLSGVQRSRFQARMDEIRKVLADSGRRGGR